MLYQQYQYMNDMELQVWKQMRQNCSLAQLLVSLIDEVILELIHVNDLWRCLHL